MYFSLCLNTQIYFPAQFPLFWSWIPHTAIGENIWLQCMHWRLVTYRSSWQVGDLEIGEPSVRILDLATTGSFHTLPKPSASLLSKRTKSDFNRSPKALAWSLPWQETAPRDCTELVSKPVPKTSTFEIVTLCRTIPS